MTHNQIHIYAIAYAGRVEMRESRIEAATVICRIRDVDEHTDIPHRIPSASCTSSTPCFKNGYGSLPFAYLWGPNNTGTIQTRETLRERRSELPPVGATDITRNIQFDSALLLMVPEYE